MSSKIQVIAEDDFLQRQSRADPIKALAELIWNGLDSDASKVHIELTKNDLSSGLSKITIYDNGQGFSYEDAKSLFGQLGGSWKRVSRKTKQLGRALHGQEGKGRYKALSLGDVVEWKVCYQDVNQKKKSFSVLLKERDLKNVEISEVVDAPTQELGVTVEISEIKKNFDIFSNEAGYQELCEIFALYLTDYKGIKISIQDRTLDPEKAISEKTEYTLGKFPNADGKPHEALFRVIEWARNTKKSLYLCNEDRFPLYGIETRFHVGNFSFSAYLQHPYIDHLVSEGRLELGELDSQLNFIIDAAKNKIKEHFRNRSAEKARSVVDSWKNEDVYPYKGEAQNLVEQVERQVFDIVAVSVEELAPEISVASQKTKAFHLQLLRHAIEKSPSDLQLIFKEVLNLPQKKQQELANLLQETTLSSIIAAAKTVADRLKFIAALENIVFDVEMKKRLKERSQLHKIIADNTWIFGEEYNLWVSDKDLKRVLEKYKQHFDPNIIIDEPVEVDGQKRGIIDLMLSRSTRRHRADDIENLVIELKAPSVKIGSDALTQIKKYSQAVSKDERFNTVKGVRWHFWVISNDYDDFVRNEIDTGPDPERRLVNKNGNIIVGVKTWGEIIEENRARLQFFQESLQHNVDEDTALKYLQERHKKLVEGVIQDESDNNQSSDNEA